MIRLDDMRLFAQVAQTGSFTAAAKTLGLPKQTVSRRFAELEEALGVQLAHRTTRQLKLTNAGQAYAQKCAQLVKLAEEANRDISNAAESPTGQLHLTADPTYGEAFLSALISEYLQTYPQVTLELHLTNRLVDLIDEGFDAAFRIGRLLDSSLIARKLGPAKLLYLASPAYLAANGHPKTPRALGEHHCIEFAPGRSESRWPFTGPDGQFTVSIKGRIRVNSLRLAREKALEGFGIVNLPEYACAADIESGSLKPVLTDWVTDVGAIYLIYPQHRLAAHVRCFVDLAIERLAHKPR